MTTNNEKSRIISTMEQATGNVTDIFIALYTEYMKDRESAWENFRTIVDGPIIDEDEDEDDISITVSKEKKEELKYVYYGMIRTTTHVLALKNMSEDEFYRKLYETVFNTDIIPDDNNTRGFILEMIAQHIPDVPYKKFENLLSMSDEEYIEYLDMLEEQKNKVIYILKRDLNTKTEIMSQIYDISEQLPDRIQRIVFWTIVMDLFKGAAANEQQ